MLLEYASECPELKLHAKVILLAATMCPLSTVIASQGLANEHELACSICTCCCEMHDAGSLQTSQCEASIITEDTMQNSPESSVRKASTVSTGGG